MSKQKVASSEELIADISDTPIFSYNRGKSRGKSQTNVYKERTVNSVFFYYWFFKRDSEFWTKSQFLNTISIFEQNLNFWTASQFLNKISIFEQNLNFWTKSCFFNKISVYEQNLNFWRKSPFLKQISIFGKKNSILKKISKLTYLFLQNTMHPFLEDFFQSRDLLTERISNN